MSSGGAVVADNQRLPGHSLLLADPVVEHLTDLSYGDRSRLLSDMALIEEALHACTDAFWGNHEILGNGDAALHANVFPRFGEEPEQCRRAPVWAYPSEVRASESFSPAKHGDLRSRLATYLIHRLNG